MKVRRAIAAAACGVTFVVAGCTGDRPDSRSSQPSATPTQSSVASVGRLIDLGVVAAGQGRFDEAKANFEQAVLADPGNTVAWFDLGFLAHSRSQVAEAIKNYDKALECDGSYTPAMFNKAILLEVDQPDAAIDLYRKIIQIDDKASTTLVRLGFLLLRKGDTNGARTAFARAMKLDPALATAVPSAYGGKRPA